MLRFCGICTQPTDQVKSVVKKHFKPLSALKRKLSKRPARIFPYDARARNVCAVEEGLHSKTNKHTHTQARTSTQLTCPARLVSSRLSVVSRRHCCGHTRTRTYEQKNAGGSKRNCVKLCPLVVVARWDARVNTDERVRVGECVRVFETSVLVRSSRCTAWVGVFRCDEFLECGGLAHACRVCVCV